jgi:hypothetical protein
MKNFIRQHKIMVIAGVCIIMGIGVYVVFTNPKQSTQNNPSITSAVSPSGTQTTGIPKTNNSLWVTQSNNLYTLQYPQNWRPQTSQVAGGGNLTLLQPANLPSGVVYPQLIIETAPANPQLLQQKIAILKAIGLQQSTTTIGNIPADKLSGTIPFKIQSGTTIQQPVQETDILFTKDTTLFVYKYSYDGAQVSSVLEAYFSAMIDSIVLK